MTAIQEYRVLDVEGGLPIANAVSRPSSSHISDGMVSVQFHSMPSNQRQERMDPLCQTACSFSDPGPFMNFSSNRQS